MSGVPIIDLGAFASGRPPVAALRALDRACRDHGFFLLTGHGLDAEIDRAWRAARRFFAAPVAVKRAVQRSQDNALGYFDRELTKRKRDLKEVFDYGDDAHETGNTGFGRSRWPEGLDGFRDDLLTYARASAGLTTRVLGVVYTALGLGPAEVPPEIGERQSAFVRLNHYPVDDLLQGPEREQTVPLGDMALHHHTDPGVITLLLQDEVGGLQTCSEEAGWIDVPPHPGAVVVNLSDMMQVLTNDRYRASIHRVLPVPGRDRYSIVYFAMPSHDAVLSPQQGLYEGPPVYRAFPWAEFIGGRLSDNFADYGAEDIQIAHFRTDAASPRGQAAGAP